MTAEASHTGASISPDPAAGRSYAGPVVYTVTAEDGATAESSVTGSVAPNNATEITGFSITGPASAEGVIDEAARRITVTVPYGTDVSAMTAEARHTGASISPDPAAGRSYAGPVVYTITAADGTTQAYTVTVDAAKIASVTAVNGSFTAPHGFAKTGGDISGAIAGAITSVAGADSLGTVIALAPADYSVDPLIPAVAGADTNATLRVPAGRTSAGADIAEDFAVYIKKDTKAITAFAIAGAEGVIDEAARTISVTLPYGTELRALAAMTAEANHTGASIDPDPTERRDYTEPVTYTVTAEDGTSLPYTVTVSVAPGITISGISVEGVPDLTFANVPAEPVAPFTPIVIDLQDITADGWLIEILGRAFSATSAAKTFEAPAASGFYSINVFATAGDNLYSGSFGLIVE
jgi:hypothetical protein